MANLQGLVLEVGFNDSNFTSGMKGVNQKLKQAQSEFKATSAIVGKNSESIEGLSAKLKAAEKVYDAQKNKVNELKKKLDATRESIEKNEKATQKDKDALLRQSQAYNNAVAQLGKYDKQVNDIEADLQKATKSTSGYNAELGKLSKHTGAFSNLGNSLNSIADKSEKVGKSMTAMVSVPVAGALATAGKSAVTFNDEMIKMQAVSGASKKDMDKLKESSLNAAKTYGVSTKEYNAATTELLKSGYTAKESMSIMEAGIKTSKATGEELETVLDKTANTMKIFGYSAKDASVVTDKLAYVANASKSSINELGDGLTKVGPVAHSLGINLDTTASALGVLQDRGFKVEEAATGLKSGLANLINPSKQNAEAFEKLGLNMEDIRKNGVNLPEILDKMSESTKGMSDSQKEAYISAAFGKESMAQWTALMDGDARKALESYTKGSKEATGSVDSLWNKMKESPKQQINEFKGSFESLAINIGNEVIPVVMPFLTEFTKSINKLVDWFGKLDSGTQKTIVKFGLIATAAGPALIAFNKIVKTVRSVHSGFSKTREIIQKFSNKMKDAGNASNTADTKVSNFQKTVKGINNDNGTQGISKIENSFDNVKKSAGGAAKNVDKISKNATNLSNEQSKQGIKKLDDSFNNLGRTSSTAKNNISKISSATTNLSNETNKQSINKLQTSFSDLKGTAKSTSSSIGKIASKTMNLNKENVKTSIDGFKKSLNDIGVEADNTSSKISGVYSSAEGVNSGKGTSSKSSGKKTKGGKKSKGKGMMKGLAKGAGALAKKGGKILLFADLAASLLGVGELAAIASTAISGIGSAIALLSNPVGWTIIAVTAIGTAFTVAYKKCEPFRKFVQNIGKWCKEKFTEAWQAAKTLSKKLVKYIVEDSINPISIAVKGWKLAKEFGNKFSETYKETGSFSKSFKAAMQDTVDRVREKVESWPIVQKFQDKWESAKTKADEFATNMKGKIGDLVTSISDKVSNSSIAKSFKSIFNSANKSVHHVLGKMASGAGGLLKKLGADELGGSLEKWGEEAKKYKDGTPKDGHPGGLMRINDGYGPNYKEAVLFPGHKQPVMFNGSNVEMYAPKGTQVLNGRDTAKIYKYKDGTGSWWDNALEFGKDMVGKAVSKMEDLIGDVMDWFDKPKELVDKVIDSFVGGFGGKKGYGLEFAKTSVSKGKDALVNKVKELLDSMMGGGIDGGHGHLGSNNWINVNGNRVREWQYKLLEPLIKQYKFYVTSALRPGDPHDHGKGRAMDIALPGNPQDIYWEVAQQIDAMPLVKYVNSNLKSSMGHKGKFTPSNLEPRADHIHVSFIKETLSEEELKPTTGGGGAIPPGTGVERWRPMVKRALAANGLPTSDAYVNAWLRQIQSESNGNPNAVQNGYVDINTLTGNLARGILQVIPPTFAAYKHPGHNNIMNPYDNMLAAMNYAKKRYGASGMLSVIGHGHGYEKGGLVTTHQMAQLAEGNKPEMVIPLTNKSRSVQLINKAKKLIGEDEFINDTSNIDEQNQLLKEVNSGINQMINLLGALLNKDTSLYINDKEIAKATAKATQQELTNQRINLNRLRGITNV